MIPLVPSPQQQSAQSQTFIERLSINANLNLEQKQALATLLEKFKSAFSQTESDRGKTDLVEHTIRLNTAEPIKQAPNRVPPQKRAIIQQKVEEIKQQSIIVDSQSPFASPVVLIRKKNGDWRFCADCRALNQATIKDAYPLPRIDDALDTLRANSHFTILDLVSI